jgi:hypothetical protein
MIVPLLEGRRGSRRLPPVIWRRHVSLQSLGARGLRPDAFAALVGRYPAASRARGHLSAENEGI